MARKKKTTPKSLQTVKKEIDFTTIEQVQKRPIPWIFILVFVLLASLFFVFKGLFVAAIVNNQPITRYALIKELEKQGGSQILDSLIVQSLIKSEAARKNVVVTDKELDDQIKKLDASLSKQGQKLDIILEAQGMTRSDLKDQTSMQLSIEKLLADKVMVSEKEIDEFLKTQINEEDPSISPEVSNREEIREQLKQQKLQTEASKLIEELRKNAKIYTFVNF